MWHDPSLDAMIFEARDMAINGRYLCNQHASGQTNLCKASLSGKDVITKAPILAIVVKLSE